MNIPNLEAMLASGRDNALLRFGLGKAYLDAQDYVPAAEHLRQCVVHDPGYSAAWKFLGRALLESGDEPAARAAWAEGMQAAAAKGDKQAEKEMGVFLRRLDKQARNDAVS